MTSEMFLNAVFNCASVALAMSVTVPGLRQNEVENKDGDEKEEADEHDK
jgi:hypothetical protein